MFTNTGVEHTLEPGVGVTMGQGKYIANLKPIQHKDIVGARGEDFATEHLQTAFMSLLGGIAYALLTQQWISVYVVALQRYMQKCIYLHIRRLTWC